MKFSTAFTLLVLVAVTTAETDVLLKEFETKNYKNLSPVLLDVSRKLYLNLYSDSFKFRSTYEIHNYMTAVLLKVEIISDDVTSIVSQIESVGHNGNRLNISDAVLAYKEKKNRIKKLCGDTLTTTNVVLRLIDETNKMLGEGVTQNTLEKIRNYDKSFLRNYRLMKFEDICQTMRKGLDSERTDISKIEGKIKGIRDTVNAITEEVDRENISEQDLITITDTLGQTTDQLRYEVLKIKRHRISSDGDM